MLVRFWGTRGSIATPGLLTARYGGNTSCVSIQAEDGTVIVLDCGTGARELGLHLVESAATPLRVHLFIGHTHWDHIQGFPFFLPAFRPDVELNVYAPAGFQRNLAGTLAGQMQYSYFPVKLQDLRSRIHFTELEEGFFRVGSVLVETRHLNHTAPTIAYRISDRGATVVYATDHEPFWQSRDQVFHHPGDLEHIAFLKDAHLLIHDAQYADEEYASRRGWGHSTIEYATDVAIAAGAERLALFHHDPAHDDLTIDRFQDRVRQRVIDRQARLDVFAASEGLQIDVRGKPLAGTVVAASALLRRPIAGRQVLVVSNNDAEVATVGQALSEDGLMLVPVPDAAGAAARTKDLVPDLVIIDDSRREADTSGLIRDLRGHLGRRHLPIIVLTEDQDAELVLRRRAAGATDYLAKPYSPPMLRARVQAWLARMQTKDDSKAIDRGRRTAGGVPASARTKRRGTVDDLAGAIDATAAQPGTIADPVAALAAVPMFRLLRREHLELLARHVSERAYWPGQIIIHEGDPAESLFVVRRGRVRIVESVADLAQMEMLLGELGVGQVFGELAILSDLLRSATVVAAEHTECLLLPKDEFAEVLQGSPDLCVRLLRVLASRIYDTNRLLARYSPDPLTGLASRRGFDEQYSRVVARARRRQSWLMLLMLDIRRLQEINDRHGYAVGDLVLCTVADGLREATRTTDLIIRHGGDEFVALLEDMQPEESSVIAARVHQKIAELALRRDLPVAIPCRIGVALTNQPSDSAEALLREADRDMYSEPDSRGSATGLDPSGVGDRPAADPDRGTRRD